MGESAANAVKGRMEQNRAGRARHRKLMRRMLTAFAPQFPRAGFAKIKGNFCVNINCMLHAINIDYVHEKP